MIVRFKDVQKLVSIREPFAVQMKIVKVVTLKMEHVWIVKLDIKAKTVNLVIIDFTYR